MSGFVAVTTIALGAVAVVAAPRASAAQVPAAVAGADDVRVAVAGQATVRVLVELSGGYVPDAAALAAPSAGRPPQRARIASAQAALADDVPADGSRADRFFTTLPYASFTLTPAGVEAIAADPLVASMRPLSLAAPADDVGVPSTGAPTAWSQGITGAGWTVAVIDSGVDSSHPYLAGKFGTGVDGKGDGGACFASGEEHAAGTGDCPGGGNQATGVAAAAPCAAVVDGCDHGTHVAGIATGDAVTGSHGNGVAPDADLYPVQVFSRFDDPARCGSSKPCALSWEDDQLAALEHVYLQRDHYQFAAVNFSLGTGANASPCGNANPAFTTAVSNLQAADIAVVAAAGNAGDPHTISFPACVPGVVSVGAADSTGDRVSSFSNAAPFLSLLAPGTGIWSCVPGGGFSDMSGTSMAAPMVAGAWALARQRIPAASVRAVLDSFRSTGRRTPDDRVTPPVTYPRLDVAAAFAAQAPPSLTVAGRADSRVSLAWTAPTRTPTVLRYEVEARPGTGVTDVGMRLATDVRGLTNGRAYRFRVRTVTAAGPGPWSEAVVATPARAPDAPVPSATVAAGILAVTWTGPYDGGDPITEYAVRVTSLPTGAAASRTVPPDTTRTLLAAPAGGGPFDVTVTAANAIGAGPAGTVRVAVADPVPPEPVPTPPPTPGPAADQLYHGLAAPERLVDTRDQGRRINPFMPLAVTVVGVGDVPADAAAVSINVTALDASVAGYVSVSPCGGPVPLVSSVNYVAGQVKAGHALVPVGVGGKVCILANTAVHVVVDLDGWFAADQGFTGVVPNRLVDSRTGLGWSTRLAGGEERPFTVAARGGVPARGAQAVALNVTVAGADPVAGFLALYACGDARPLVSNVNWAADEITGNAVVVPVAADGTVCVYAMPGSGAHVVVDVFGYFTAAAGGFVPVTPSRALDTRTSGARVTDAAVTLPAGAAGAVLNVTATEPAAAGFVTVYPCGQPVPTASAVNFAAGQTMPNAALAAPGVDGEVCFHSNTPTHLVVDIDGLFADAVTPTRSR